MNALAVAVLLVAVAYTSASGIGLGGAILAGPAGIIAPGLGVGSARGALEGALGGQWIPDVPVAAHGAAIAAPGLGLGLGLGGIGLGGVGLGGVGLGGVGLGGVGLGGVGLAHSRGALEGALGGQWIPDTHGK